MCRYFLSRRQWKYYTQECNKSVCRNLFCLCYFGLSWLGDVIPLNNHYECTVVTPVAGEALDAETLCELLTGVHAPDWERIGEQLGLHIKGQISAADFFDAWRQKDSHASWIKLADAVEKVEEYKHVAQTVREKEGTVLVWGMHPNTLGTVSMVLDEVPAQD